MIGDVLHDMNEDGWLERESGDAAAELLKRVDYLAQNGDRWTQLQLDQWLHEGARRTWVAHAKTGKAAFKDGRSGKLLRMPSRIAKATRRPDGTRTGAFQHPLISDASWEDIEQALDARLALRGRITEGIDALRLCLSLHRKYPNATPREAWVLNGGNPNDLEQALVV